MTDRVEVDDLGLDTRLLLDILGCPERLDDHHRCRHDGDVLALARDIAGERYATIRGRNRKVERIEQPVLDADHRPRVAIDDRRIHVEDRLAGRRHDDGKAGIVSERRLRTLRVLRALPPAAADHNANQHRTAHRAAEHVAVLGGQIDDLVHRQKGEVRPDMGGDRVVTDQGCTDRGPRHRLFHQRRVEYPLRPKLGCEAGRRTKDAFEVVDTLSHDENVGIVGESGVHRLQQCAGIGQHAAVVGLRLRRGDRHRFGLASK